MNYWTWYYRVAKVVHLNLTWFQSKAWHESMSRFDLVKDFPSTLLASRHWSFKCLNFKLKWNSGADMNHIIILFCAALEFTFTKLLQPESKFIAKVPRCRFRVNAPLMMVDRMKSNMQLYSGTFAKMKKSYRGSLVTLESQFSLSFSLQSFIKTTFIIWYFILVIQN